MIRKIFNRMDTPIKVSLAVIALYLFLYVWLDFLELICKAMFL